MNIQKRNEIIEYISESIKCSDMVKTKTTVYPPKNNGTKNMVITITLTTAGDNTTTTIHEGISGQRFLREFA